MKKVLAVLMMLFFLAGAEGASAMLVKDVPATHPSVPPSPEEQLKFFEELANKRVEEAKNLKIFEKVKEIWTIEKSRNGALSQEFIFEYKELYGKSKAGKSFTEGTAVIWYKKEQVFYAAKRIYTSGLSDTTIQVYRPDAVWLGKMESLRQEALKKEIFEKIRDLKLRYGL